MKKSKRHRTRSRSRSRSKQNGRHDVSERLHSLSPPKRPRTSDEDQASLSTILKTLQEVLQDLKSTNARVENHWQQSLPAFPPKLSVESDALSVLAYSDVDLLSDEEGSIMASKLPTQANEPPARDNDTPTWVFEHQGKAVKPSNEAGKQGNEANVPSNGGDLYDPATPFAGTQSRFYRCFAEKKRPSEVILPSNK